MAYLVYMEGSQMQFSIKTSGQRYAEAELKSNAPFGLERGRFFPIHCVEIGLIFSPILSALCFYSYEFIEQFFSAILAWINRSIIAA